MKKSILMVDDFVVIRKIVKKAVSSLDFEFLEANDGAEALSIIRKSHASISLILMDWNMPKMNGFELLTMLKGNPMYKNIPVIMVTTEGGKGNIVKAMQAGATNYILKPFDTEELFKKIVQSIG